MGSHGARPVFYTHKSSRCSFSVRGEQEALSKIIEDAISIAQGEVARGRISSAVEVSAEQPDQGDGIAEGIGRLKPFFFA